MKGQTLLDFAIITGIVNMGWAAFWAAGEIKLNALGTNGDLTALIGLAVGGALGIVSTTFLVLARSRGLEVPPLPNRDEGSVTVTLPKVV